ARKPLPPTELKLDPQSREYDLRGDSKTLWEQIAAQLHLTVLFDTQYQPTQPFRFQLGESAGRDALNALEVDTNSFFVPISERLIYVANDTPQKRIEYARTATVVFPFNEVISTQEIVEIGTGVRGILDTQRMQIDTQRHLILMRDQVAKVRLAQKLFED